MTIENQDITGNISTLDDYLSTVVNECETLEELQKKEFLLHVALEHVRKTLFQRIKQDKSMIT